VTAANRAGLAYVIIGGFAVIANQYVRGTEDVDLLIPEDRVRDATVLEFLGSIEANRNGRPVTALVLETAETLRVASRCGPVDLLRGGAPPLDFNTVSESAIRLNYHDQPARVASLASLVAFKRLADRPRDRLDLIELERIHGPLPSQPLSAPDG
jgi:hypothetical protein